MDLGVTDKVKPLIDKVRQMVSDDIEPLDQEFHEEVGKHPSGSRWQFTERQMEILTHLKSLAKERGLWNFWLTDSEKGYGLSTVEYAYLAEEMGKVGIAAEVFNCSAPDTGNMEVIERYGNENHKKKWLAKLLEGEIRSAYLMTEPDVASSDATNISLEAKKDGDHWVLNGQKWWSSGVGDPRCKVFIVMALTDPDAAKHSRHSMFFVDADSEGFEVLRYMNVFGADDAPHGHGHCKFTNVKVPAENLILGEGRGFEVSQGRLGPGRIHHCMRAIGAGEVALELMCRRGIDPEKIAFGKNLARLGANFDYIAESRIELNAARFLTLDAAVKMDAVGNKIAASEIAQIKVYAPNVALKIIDRAIQIHGGEGVSQLTPLASMYAHMRTLRLADGPDEVHRRAVARHELGKYMA